MSPRKGVRTVPSSSTYRDPKLLDPDYNKAQALVNKAGQPITPAELAQRFEDRDGNRELDFLVQHAPKMSQAHKDAQRAFPLDETQPLEDLRKDRSLPQPGEMRTLLSSRQRKERSKDKVAAQSTLSNAQYEDLGRLIRTDRGDHWNEINDKLHEAKGNATELDDATARRVRRIDRAIRAYERDNDRGHLVYCNVDMPRHINRTNLNGYARNQFEPGTLVEFDRYTAATHCLHEVEPYADPEASIAFEITTRRGMYLGGSDSAWYTPHLLPRGMRLYSHGQQVVQYQRPDGTTGSRVVVQLSEDPPQGVDVITPVDRLIENEKLMEKRAARQRRKAEREAALQRAREENPDE